MNELIRKFETEIVHLDDEIYERYERMLSDIEWFDTLKFQFRKFAEETGINKWTTDRWQMSYIEQRPSKAIDTDRMKKENILIVNAETGELEEVNAYEYFCTKTVNRSPYVKAKEREE